MGSGGTVALNVCGAATAEQAAALGIGMAVIALRGVYRAQGDVVRGLQGHLAVLCGELRGIQGNVAGSGLSRYARGLDGEVIACAQAAAGEALC